ncbi:MAG: hypothetical protein LBF56_01830 [Holosporales bacterium]|jgi:hypothetical protein|nr:hypothetical protein [Holosporales bacterium]
MKKVLIGALTLLVTASVCDTSASTANTAVAINKDFTINAGGVTKIDNNTVVTLENSIKIHIHGELDGPAETATIDGGAGSKVILYCHKLKEPTDKSTLTSGYTNSLNTAISKAYTIEGGGTITNKDHITFTTTTFETSSDLWDEISNGKNNTSDLVLLRGASDEASMGAADVPAYLHTVTQTVNAHIANDCASYHHGLEVPSGNFTLTGNLSKFTNNELKVSGTGQLTLSGVNSLPAAPIIVDGASARLTIGNNDSTVRTAMNDIRVGPGATFNLTSPLTIPDGKTLYLGSQLL